MSLAASECSFGGQGVVRPDLPQRIVRGGFHESRVVVDVVKSRGRQRQEMSAVLGVTVGAGQRLTPTNALICGWAQPSDPNHTGKRVVLSIYGQLGSRTPADRFATAKTPVQGIQKTPVAGVGDDAFYATTPGLGTGLIFKKGESAFVLNVSARPHGRL